jgi:hypothetical protein
MERKMASRRMQIVAAAFAIHVTRSVPTAALASIARQEIAKSFKGSKHASQLL